MDRELQQFIDTVETWQMQRVGLAQGFHQKGLREFVEVQNFLTRKLISQAQRSDPEFWSAVAELATNASTLTTPGAKIFADKQDRTNL